MHPRVRTILKQAGLCRELPSWMVDLRIVLGSRLASAVAPTGSTALEGIIETSRITTPLLKAGLIPTVLPTSVTLIRMP